MVTFISSGVIDEAAKTLSTLWRERYCSLWPCVPSLPSLSFYPCSHFSCSRILYSWTHSILFQFSASGQWFLHPEGFSLLQRSFKPRFRWPFPNTSSLSSQVHLGLPSVCVLKAQDSYSFPVPCRLIAMKVSEGLLDWFAPLVGIYTLAVQGTLSACAALCPQCLAHCLAHSGCS